MAALYKRSLHLAGATHPWMAATNDGVLAALDPAALKSLFTLQSRADAAAGGDALLKTFHELLATLIGPSLTERLLRSVWANSSDGKPSEDTRA